MASHQCSQRECQYIMNDHLKLKQTFEEFKETSKMYEQELENELENEREEKFKLYQQITLLKSKLQDLKVTFQSKTEFNKDQQILENQIIKLEQYNQQKDQIIKSQKIQIVFLENDFDQVENLQRQKINFRMKDYKTQELQYQSDNLVEQLIIKQTEFEQYKNQSQENLERVNAQLQGNKFTLDTQDELNAVKVKQTREVLRLMIKSYREQQSQNLAKNYQENVYVETQETQESLHQPTLKIKKKKKFSIFKNIFKAIKTRLL